MTREDLTDAIMARGGLVNAADLARRWDISAARVGQLVREPTFPAPVATVGGRPVWLLDDARAWRTTRREMLRKRRQRGQRGGAYLGHRGF